MGQVVYSAPVAQQLISETHPAAAPGSVGLRAGLQIDGGPVRTIWPETEHLLLGPPSVRHQQLQLTGPLDEHAGSAERRRRFDADGGASGGGQVGFEDQPEGLARIDPPHRALRTAQAHLEHDPGVESGCKTAGSSGGARSSN